MRTNRKILSIVISCLQEKSQGSPAIRDRPPLMMQLLQSVEELRGFIGFLLTNYESYYLERQIMSI